MVRWALRLARLITSGSPEKEPKGGMPLTAVYWAEEGKAISEIVANANMRLKTRVMAWLLKEFLLFSRNAGFMLLDLESGGGEAGVGGDGLSLEIKDKAIV